jgi:Protein of unknown function (DUF3072)
MAHRKTHPRQHPSAGNARKDPEEWTTGDEPMTAAQSSYLRPLCAEAGEPMDETLTKAQAAQRIDALQQQTGRGVDDQRAARSRPPSSVLRRPAWLGTRGKIPKSGRRGMSP